MKNIEKYDREIRVRTLDCDFRRQYVLKGKCGSINCALCWSATVDWLNSEYKPQIDWSNVPVDTPVVVKPESCGEFIRHFEKFDDEVEYVDM